MNGSSTDEFIAQDSLKQQDLLAPFFYLIVAKELTTEGSIGKRLQGGV